MQLFRFANPDFLYLLLLLPVIAVLWALRTAWRKKALQKLGNTILLRQLMPEYSASRSVIKLVLRLMALASVIIMLARPQFGSRLEEVRRQVLK